MPFDYSGESEVRNLATTNILKSQLRLVLENGYHPTTGEVMLKTKTFNNVKVDAEPEKLLAVAEAFAGLQQLPLFSVERLDQSEIIAQN